jgi:hypothetical protein
MFPVIPLEPFMSTIELTPDMTSCIETVARREYNDAARTLMTATFPDEAIKERTEVLRLFLETADFRKLRAESEKHILNGKRVKFVVSLEDEQLRYEMLVS